MALGVSGVAVPWGFVGGGCGDWWVSPARGVWCLCAVGIGGEHVVWVCIAGRVPVGCVWWRCAVGIGGGHVVVGVSGVGGVSCLVAFRCRVKWCHVVSCPVVSRRVASCRVASRHLMMLTLIL